MLSVCLLSMSYVMCESVPYLFSLKASQTIFFSFHLAIYMHILSVWHAQNDFIYL